ncbi:hypothetical protein CWC05_23245, partial [Pseudoalteromonas ruthenica]
VKVSHSNATSLVFSAVDVLDIPKRLRALQFSSYVFDASVYEIFVFLLHGHELHICTDEQRHDPTALGELIAAQHIECATLPPVMLSQLDYTV